MLEDLRFSNPACPEQWDDAVKRLREQSEGGARPCLVFDQTNQYIAQVVNDSRQNKPGIKVIPVDSGADIEVAEKLEGIVRHIEYSSRAGKLGRASCRERVCQYVYISGVAVA